MGAATAFSRLAVLGTGLIGGSFALAVREHFPGIYRVGWDRADVLERARRRGAIDEGCAEIAAAVRGADLIYVALPVVPAIEALPEIARQASASALVTDAGGTKAAIGRAAANLFPPPACFLGGHPIAGKEAAGIEHAEAELFRGEKYALIAREEEAEPRVAGFAALMRQLGARVVWCDAETHDWAVGIVSHLPQLLAVALAGVTLDEMDETGWPLELAGPGLRDTIRLAGSPYAVWRDICLTNTSNIERALERVEQALERLQTRLTGKDLELEFAAANELYGTLRKLQ